LKLEVELMSKLNYQQSGKIKLDIGGCRYHTTISTLTKYPNSYFGSMFSGRHKIEKDEEGCVFIDRDGKYFKYVLKYLREDDDWEQPTDKDINKKLNKEFSFYRLPLPIYKQIFNDSVILDNNTKHLLINWLEESQLFFNCYLLYRGTRDGFESSVFHQKCDNKGSTITIIKTTSNYIFGGYTSVSWSSLEKDKDSSVDNQCFIFSLKNPYNLPMKIKKINNRKSILTNPNFGPIFGSDPTSFSMGYDIIINIKSLKPTSDYFSRRYTSKSCYTHLGGSFTCPQGYDGKTFLCGSEYFILREIEIWKVNDEDEYDNLPYDL